MKLLCFMGLGLSFASSVVAQGIALRGVGAVNDGMAGAGVAAPLDAAGAIHWNPASIASFDYNQASFGMMLVVPDLEVSSSIFGIDGVSRSESGVAPIPVMGIVHRTADPRINLGLGIYGIAGFKVNYDVSQTNPILLPQASMGLIPSLGRVNMEAEFFQIAPTISYAMTERLSLGFAPTMTLGRLAINPFIGAPPEAGIYPESSGSRYHFGGGFQVGMRYLLNEDWAIGASFKSPQWFENFRFKSQYPSGAPYRGDLKFDYPMIVSLGSAYYGLPGIVWATDFRYFNYEAADGFGDAGMNPDGSIMGTGWKDVFSVATGLQRELTERFAVRCGYVFNTSPIRDDNLLINVAAPVITRHIATVGFSYRLTEQLTFSAAYLHAFRSRQTGPYLDLVPGSTLELSTAAYALSTGLTVSW